MADSATIISARHSAFGSEATTQSVPTADASLVGWSCRRRRGGSEVAVLARPVRAEGGGVVPVEAHGGSPFTRRVWLYVYSTLYKK